MKNLNEIELRRVLENIPDSVITITFVSYEYIKIFEWFYSFWKKHDLQNLLVICLDEPTKNFVDRFGLHSCLYIYNIKSRHNFWRFRLQVLNDIFTISKKTIIHTDVDCFWIKNIERLISNCNNVDAIYSIGRSYPKNIVAKHGFVFCCGFFAIKYNKNTEDFLLNILNEPLKDDQIATNNLIFNKASQISACDDLRDNLFSYIVQTASILIGGLNNKIVTRWTSPTKTVLENCYCYHPYLTGSTEDKINTINQALYNSIDLK